MNREIVLKSYLENAEILKKRNTENIEKFRKGEFTLAFSSCKPRKITVKQTKHAFLFGCNAFMLDSFEIPEKEPIYKEKFAKLFNQAVVPFYWSALEPVEGRLRFHKDSEKIYRRPTPDYVLDFCKEYDIEPKGHCLLWGIALPEWLQKYSAEEKKKIVERRFKEIAEEYADKIPSFDVINESASHYRSGMDALFERYDEIALQLGGKYFPNNKKIINETNEALWFAYPEHGKYMPFVAQLNDFLRRGLPIDEIGLQYHIFQREEYLCGNNLNFFLNAKYMLEILDIYNAYGLPMHISEITVPSFWNSGETNEEIQAEIVAWLYETWFATEHMKSIVWWNLADGYAAWAPQNTGEGENYYAAGLLRYDLSEKPVYKTLDKLINHDWKTNFETKTEKQEYSFRGFYGKYQITVEDETGAKTVEVDFNENGKKITL